MWFLVRVVFWLTIVILLLPTAPSPSTAQGPQFTVTQALSASSAAVLDMGQFCARQPDACVVGSQAIVAFGQKTEATANMIYDLIINKQGKGGGATIRAENTEKSTQKASQDTLTRFDLAEPWASPQPVSSSRIVSRVP
jgi:hypothetical protein